MYNFLMIFNFQESTGALYFCGLCSGSSSSFFSGSGFDFGSKGTKTWGKLTKLYPTTITSSDNKNEIQFIRNH